MYQEEKGSEGIRVGELWMEMKEWRKYLKNVSWSIICFSSEHKLTEHKFRCQTDRALIATHVRQCLTDRALIVTHVRQYAKEKKLNAW